MSVNNTQTINLNKINNSQLKEDYKNIDKPHFDNKERIALNTYAKIQAKKDANHEASVNKELDPYAMPGSIGVKNISKSTDAKYSNALLERLVDKTDHGDFHKTTIQYYEKSLGYLKNIDDNMNKMVNKGLKSIQETQELQNKTLSTLAKSLSEGDLFNALKSIGSNVITKADKTGTAEMIKSMGSLFKGMLQDGAISDMIKSSVSNKIEEGIVGAFSNVMKMNKKNVMTMYSKGKEDLPGLFQQMINMAGGSNNAALQALFGASFMGTKFEPKVISNRKQATDEAIFDHQFHTSVVEVIPETLSQILAAIKGTEVTRYDIGEDKWKRRSDIFRENEASNRVSADVYVKQMATQITSQIADLASENVIPQFEQAIKRKDGRIERDYTSSTGIFKQGEHVNIILKKMLASKYVPQDFALEGNVKTFLKKIGISDQDTILALSPTANALLELFRRDYETNTDLEDSIKSFREQTSKMTSNNLLKGMSREESSILEKYISGELKSADMYGIYGGNGLKSGGRKSTIPGVGKPSSSGHVADYETVGFGQIDMAEKLKKEMQHEIKIAINEEEIKSTLAEKGIEDKGHGIQKAKAAMKFFSKLEEANYTAGTVSMSNPNITYANAVSLGYPSDYTDLYRYMRYNKETNSYTFDDAAYSRVFKTIKISEANAEKAISRERKMSDMDIMDPAKTISNITANLFKDPKIAKLTGVGGGTAAGIGIAKMLSDANIVTSPKAMWVLGAMGGVLGNMEKSQNFMTNTFGPAGQIKNKKGMSNQDIFLMKLTQKYIPALGAGTKVGSSIFKGMSQFGLPGMIAGLPMALIGGGVSAYLAPKLMSWAKGKLFKKRKEGEKAGFFGTIGDIMKEIPGVAKFLGVEHTREDASIASTTGRMHETILTKEQSKASTEEQRDVIGAVMIIFNEMLTKIERIKKEDRDKRDIIFNIIEEYYNKAKEVKGAEHVLYVFNKFKEGLIVEFEANDAAGDRGYIDISKLKATNWTKIQEDENLSDVKDRMATARTETLEIRQALMKGELEFESTNIEDIINKVRTAIKNNKGKKLSKDNVIKLLDIDPQYLDIVWTIIQENMLRQEYAEAKRRQIESFMEKKTGTIDESLVNTLLLQSLNKEIGGTFEEQLKKEFSNTIAGSVMKMKGIQDVLNIDYGTEHNVQFLDQFAQLMGSNISSNVRMDENERVELDNKLNAGKRQQEEEEFKKYMDNLEKEKESGKGPSKKYIRKTMKELSSKSNKNGFKIGEAGCGLLALNDALVKLNIAPIDLDVLSDEARHHIDSSTGGIRLSFFRAIAKKTNIFSVNSIPGSIPILPSNKNEAVIFLIKNTADDGYHYVTFDSYDKGTKTIYYMDPEHKTKQNMTMSSLNMRLSMSILIKKNNVEDKINKGISSATKSLSSGIKGMYNKGVDKVKGIVGGAKDFVNDKLNMVKSMPGKMFNKASDSFKDMMNTAMSMMPIGNMQPIQNVRIVEDLTLPLTMGDTQASKNILRKMKGTIKDKQALKMADKISNMTNDSEFRDEQNQAQAVQDAIMNGALTTKSGSGGAEATVAPEDNNSGNLFSGLFSAFVGTTLGAKVIKKTKAIKSAAKSKVSKALSGPKKLIAKMFNGVKNITKQIIDGLTKPIMKLCKNVIGSIGSYASKVISVLPKFLGDKIMKFMGGILEKSGAVITKLFKRFLSGGNLVKAMGTKALKKVPFLNIAFVVYEVFNAFMNAEEIAGKDLSIMKKVELAGIALVYYGLPAVITTMSSLAGPLSFVAIAISTGIEILYPFEEFYKDFSSMTSNISDAISKKETDITETDSGTIISSRKSILGGLFSKDEGSTYISNEFKKQTGMSNEDVTSIIQKSKESGIDAKQALTDIGTKRMSGNRDYNFDAYQKGINEQKSKTGMSTAEAQKSYSKSTTNEDEAANREKISKMISSTPPKSGATLENGLLNPLGGSNLLVTSAMGQRNVVGGSSDHKGIDLRAGHGTPVNAIAGGTVVAIPSENDYGYYTIQQADGKLVRYMHLGSDVANKKVGDTVEAGEVLGLAGGMGKKGPKTYGPHLHLDIKENGKFIDPVKVLGLTAGNFKRGEPENERYLAKASGLGTKTADEAIELGPNVEKGGSNDIYKIRSDISRVKSTLSNPRGALINSIDDSDTRRAVSKIADIGKYKEGSGVLANVKKLGYDNMMHESDLHPQIKSAINKATGSGRTPISDVPGKATDVISKTYDKTNERIANQLGGIERSFNTGFDRLINELKSLFEMNMKNQEANKPSKL